MNGKEIRQFFRTLAESPKDAVAILEGEETPAYAETSLNAEDDDFPVDCRKCGENRRLEGQYVCPDCFEAIHDEQPDDMTLASDQAGDQDDDPSPDGESDDVVPVDAMDVDLAAEATGRVDIDASDVNSDFDGMVEADADNPETLTGIIWGAGKHDLSLNGQAAGVFVPDGETAVQVDGEEVVFEDTIEPTFRQLKADIESDDVQPTIGFDHPDQNSVAAMADLVDIGDIQDVSLSADRRNIVMTDSQLTAESAIEANQRGDLEKFDYSVVARVAKKRDDDGDVVRTDDGRIVLAGTRIQRADIVLDGAVDAASVSAMPELAAAIAADDASADASCFVATAFRAEASKHTNRTMDGLDPDDFETVEAALSSAAERVEAKEERIADLEDQVEAQEEQADAFTEIAEAEGVDVNDYDDPAEAAQAVVDARTEPLREQIAATEAELPNFDTGTDDGPSVEARKEELAGSSVQDLKVKRGDLATKALQASSKKESFGTAIAASETAGAVDDLSAGESGGAGSGGGSDDNADELAASVLAPTETMEANKRDQSPADYVEAEFDVDVSEYDSESALSAAIRGGSN